MASTLNPYIGFDNQARQALEFYHEVFGGELTLNTFGQLGGSEGAGGPDADKIMHGQLVTDSGYTLMAADSPTGLDRSRGDDISISLSGTDADELRGYWTKLSEGGTVSVPMEKQMWGDEFGMCTDKFGIAWMVNITQEA